MKRTSMEEMLSSLLQEGADAKGADLDDFFDDNQLIVDLTKAGCLDYVKNEVKGFVDSSLTNKLATNVGDMRGFMRGSVYGYVLAKTDNRKLAISASSLAAMLAKKYKKEI